MKGPLLIFKLPEFEFSVQQEGGKEHISYLRAQHVLNSKRDLGGFASKVISSIASSIRIIAGSKKSTKKTLEP